MTDYYATAAEVARLHNWTTAYVHRLARAEHWTYKNTRPRQFNLGDVARHVALTRPYRKVHIRGTW